MAWGTVYYAEGNDSYQNTYKKVQGVAWDMVYMLRVTTPIRIHTKGSGSGLGHGIYAEGYNSHQNTYKRFREWLGTLYIMLRVTTPTRIHTKGSGSDLGQCIHAEGEPTEEDTDPTSNLPWCHDSYQDSQAGAC